MIDGDDIVEQRESTIEAIFFVESDTNAFPRIVAQTPANFKTNETYMCLQTPEKYITEETFLCVIGFLIPSAQLCGQLINVNALNMNILGFPILMKNEKYPKKEFKFNLCLVFSASPSLQTLQYEPIVRKLALYFAHLELECDFISSGVNVSDIMEIMNKIRTQLNDNSFCQIVVTQTTEIMLKVSELNLQPIEVQEYDVPINVKNVEFIVELIDLIELIDFDLTVKLIWPLIDGYRYVSRISREAGVYITTTKSCIEHLIHYDVVALLPIFLHSNTYVTTPLIAQLTRFIELQTECLEYVKNTENLPTFYSVIQIYSSMKNGKTVRQLCEQFEPNTSGIDEIKLVRFGLLKGYIRRVQKYPLYLGPKPFPIDKPLRELYDLFDGNHSYDQICCAINRSHRFLDRFVESDPSIVIYHK